MLTRRSKLELEEIDKMRGSHMREPASNLERDAAIATYALGFLTHFLNYQSIELRPATVVMPGAGATMPKAPNPLDDDLTRIRNCLSIVAKAQNLSVHVALDSVCALEECSFRCVGVGHEPHVSRENFVSSEHFIHLRKNLLFELIRILEADNGPLADYHRLGVAMAHVVDVFETAAFENVVALVDAVDQSRPRSWPSCPALAELKTLVRLESNARRRCFDQLDTHLNSLRSETFAMLRTYSGSAMADDGCEGPYRMPTNAFGLSYAPKTRKLSRPGYKPVHLTPGTKEWDLLLELLLRSNNRKTLTAPEALNYQWTPRNVSALRTKLAKLNVEVTETRYELCELVQDNTVKPFSEAEST